MWPERWNRKRFHLLFLICEGDCLICRRMSSLSAWKKCLPRQNSPGVKKICSETRFCQCCRLCLIRKMFPTESPPGGDDNDFIFFTCVIDLQRVYYTDKCFIQRFGICWIWNFVSQEVHPASPTRVALSDPWRQLPEWSGEFSSFQNNFFLQVI